MLDSSICTVIFMVFMDCGVYAVCIYTGKITAEDSECIENANTSLCANIFTSRSSLFNNQYIFNQLSYFGMRKWSTAHLVKEWDQKIAKLRAKMSRISNNIRRDYMTQMKIDIQDIIKKGGKSFSNERLMHEIYDFVEEKYDWRYWFVAVYNDMKGFDEHAIASCGGHTFLHTHGKNIAVGSQDKMYSSRFEKENAAEILRSVESDVKNCVSGLRAPRERARALNGHAVRKSGNSCVPYALQMTVTSGNNLWVAGWGNHYTYRRIHLTMYNYYPHSNCSLQKSWYYNMIIFG